MLAVPVTGSPLCRKIAAKTRPAKVTKHPPGVSIEEAIMSDESVVAAVSAANAKAHIEHITTEIPSRLAGSANGKRMAEYSAAALTKAGVSAKVHEMPGLV